MASGPVRRPWLRALLLAVVVAMLSIGVGFGSGVPASSASALTADWDTAGALTIGSVSPQISDGSSDVTITGTVTNQSTDAMTPVITIGLGSRSLDTTTRLADWQSGDTTYLTNSVATTTLSQLAPSRRANWSVKIPKSALPQGSSYASLPLMVSVSTVGGPVLRSVRSSLQVVTASSVTPSLAVTWVVPLTLPADPALFGPSGDARTAAWQKAIGSGSAIDQLLTSLAGQPVTWLVDPRIVTEPVAQDDNLPAATTSPTGTASPTATAPGTSAATTTNPTGGATPTPTDTTAAPTDDPIETEMTALRERLASVTAEGQQKVWWTPLDDPDLSGLLASGDQNVLKRALSPGLPEDLRAISDTVVAAPAEAQTDRQLTQLASTWRAARGSAPVVIQPNRVVTDTGLVTTATRRATGTAGLLLYDETLSSLLSTADPSGEGAASAHLLAYTLALYLQGPSNQRSIAALVPRQLTLQPAVLAARLIATRAAAWTADHTGQQTATDLATGPVAQVRQTPSEGTPYPTPGRTGITAILLEGVEQQRRRLTGFGTILVDATNDIAARTAALDTTFSTRWRADVPSAAESLHLASTATSGLLARVAVSPGNVNFFADSGQLSVTVTSTLTRAVEGVHLTLTPRRAILQVEDPTHTLDLGVAGRATTRFHVQALAQGQVPVDATLSTPGGLVLGSPDGQTTQVQVDVRPTASWIFWVLGSLGGIVFVVGLIRAVRRGPRTAEQLDPSARTPSDAVVTVTPAPLIDDDEEE
ncbi:hypothetical protein ATK17_3163 [Branchiibius hedensis]|uniref:Uncharacterized protein n=1 Tax=Branchiibius hedensis TaxID=672460 RepID=A0A2Y8ZTQ7_9MICO|nr:hypothetical protein [Branchiibius hedensis]PWJ26980.1 hypothetical protein ATK17_3163 [Branchiibius hedensis]SSA35791.1 hypothetical protein SAMN04489750_3163 [Branchiibius hedensis]